MEKAQLRIKLQQLSSFVAIEQAFSLLHTSIPFVSEYKSTRSIYRKPRLSNMQQAFLMSSKIVKMITSQE